MSVLRCCHLIHGVVWCGRLVSSHTIGVTREVVEWHRHETRQNERRDIASYENMRRDGTTHDITRDDVAHMSDAAVPYHLFSSCPVLPRHISPHTLVEGVVSWRSGTMGHTRHIVIPRQDENDTTMCGAAVPCCLVLSHTAHRCLIP